MCQHLCMQVAFYHLFLPFCSPASLKCVLTMHCHTCMHIGCLSIPSTRCCMLLIVLLMLMLMNVDLC